MADRMLGKLAKYLRLLGFDTLYFSAPDRQRLLYLASQQDRIVLTKDTALRKRLGPSWSLFIEDNQPSTQLQAVIAAYEITAAEIHPFSRCLKCNSELIKKSRDAVASLVPHYVLATHMDFSLCPKCGRVYWRGSHRKGMEEMLHRLFSQKKLD